MDKLKTGLIYKIFSKDGDEIYIGSTIRSMKKRYAEHIANWEMDYGSLMATTYLFNKYGLENCEYEIIEKMLVKNVFMLRQREQYYIDLYSENCLNGYKASIGVKINSKNYNSLYYRLFRNELVNYHKEKIHCSRCNSKVSRRNIQSHYKTLKCFKKYIFKHPKK